MKETLKNAFRTFAANIFDAPHLTTIDEAVRCAKACEDLVGQVRQGTPPAQAQPADIGQKESRRLLQSTGIHTILTSEWTKYCETAGRPQDAAAPQYSTRKNGYLPQGWTQHLR